MERLLGWLIKLFPAPCQKWLELALILAVLLYSGWQEIQLARAKAEIATTRESFTTYIGMVKETGDQQAIDALKKEAKQNETNKQIISDFYDVNGKLVDALRMRALQAKSTNDSGGSSLPQSSFDPSRTVTTVTGSGSRACLDSRGERCEVEYPFYTGCLQDGLRLQKIKKWNFDQTR